METTTQRCKCCSTELEGKFCYNCGQRADTKRLVMKTLWLDLIYSLGSMDRGILFTLKRLFTYPGAMIKEYIEGRRVIYTKPISLLIILTTVYGLLATAMHYFKSGEMLGTDVEIASGSGVKTLDFFSFLLNSALDNILVLSLLMIPFFAWMTKLFFRRFGARSYNYTELLSMNIYMTCQRFVFDILLLTPFKWVFGDVDGWDTRVTLVVYVALVSWCFKGIFTAGWVRTIWKSALMYVLSIVASLIALITIIFLVLGIFYLFDIDSSREAFQEIFS